jgi:peroxiredoxin
MQQVVDLQNSPEFQALDVALVSIAIDTQVDLAAGAQEFGITTPLLSDADKRVSESYGVLKWAMPSGEPGHTFVLVDSSGAIIWVRDYGAPENGGLMYVPVEELVQQIEGQFNKT